MPGIFISHAASDRELVDALVELLRLGADVSGEKIFYSSGTGTGVPTGSRFNDHIREEVEKADIVIAVISPAFLESAFATAEVGAAWVIQSNFFPLTVPGLSHRDLDGVLVGVNVPSLDDGDALGELRDRICEALEIKGDTARWMKEQAKFLAKLDGLVANLKGPKKVPFDDLEKVQAELSGTQSALKEAESEKSALTERYEELKKAKTREEIAEVVVPKEETARFEELRTNAKDLLWELPGVVQTALSFHVRSEEIPRPNRFDDQYAADDVAAAEKETATWWKARASR